MEYPDRRWRYNPAVLTKVKVKLVRSNFKNDWKLPIKYKLDITYGTVCQPFEKDSYLRNLVNYGPFAGKQLKWYYDQIFIP